MISSELIGADSLKIAIASINKKFVEVDDIDYDLLNEVAWNVYLLSNDSLLLRNALMWSELTIEHDANWVWLDTYAALLYKNKMYDKAKTYAEEAYKLGNDPATEELLQKIDSVLDIQNEPIEVKEGT